MSIEAYLLRTQYNEIYEILQAQGLAPADFSWEPFDLPGNRGTRLQGVRLNHLHSTYFFAVVVTPALSGAIHTVVFSPGENSVMEERQQLAWYAVAEYAEDWAHWLNRELGVRNPWLSMTRDPGALFPQADADGTDERFSNDEARVLEAGLDDVAEQLIRSRNLQGADAEQVLEEVRGLKEDLKVLNRRQWIRVVFGAVLGQALRYGLSGGEVQTLLRSLIAHVDKIAPALFLPLPFGG